ncbi:MAG: hypothetical protein ACRCYU_17215 [Nocardioides sp.]
MTNTASRSMHDIGLAAWFGGNLANAVALNPAAGEAGAHDRTGAVVNTGWDRWTPVNAAAIGLHLAGSLGQLKGNRSRLLTQKGVGAMAVTKTVLTAAALGASAYGRMLGRKVSEQTDVPTDSGTVPATETPEQVAHALRQLRILQWVIPGLTGALVVVSALAGEQQRPQSVLHGVADRVVPER